jgi:4-amino-4-deoxy-L-arabinose transferase-like glycosyltransferase
MACLLLAAQALPYFQSRWVEDESWYSMSATNLVLHGELRNPAMPATDAESQVDTRPPLMPLSLAAAFRLLGFSVASARAGELLAAFLTVLVVYLIGRELNDEFAGSIAGVMVAADNFLVLAARSARPEAWVTLCAAAGLLLVLRSQNRNSWRIAAAAGVAAACACLFHALGLAWLVALGLILLYQERAGAFRSPRVYAYVAAFCLAILPFVWWLSASSERLAAAKSMYGRSSGATWIGIFAKERLRMSDFLGFSNSRLSLPLPFPVPFRAHIVLAIVAAFVVLLRCRGRVFWPLAIVAASFLLYILPLPNPTVRYMAVLSPVFGLALGFALTSLTTARARGAAIAICALCVISQVAGTTILLKQARNADYPTLTAKLRDAIPSGHSCYAAMTFQFALYDRPCHVYDRTPFSYTVSVQKPEYMILGDRVMMNGGGYGEDDFQDLRRDAFAFAEQRGRILQRIEDPFYGDLRIFHIVYE